MSQPISSKNARNSACSRRDCHAFPSYISTDSMLKRLPQGRGNYPQTMPLSVEPKHTSGRELDWSLSAAFPGSGIITWRPTEPSSGIRTLHLLRLNWPSPPRSPAPTLVLTLATCRMYGKPSNGANNTAGCVQRDTLSSVSRMQRKKLSTPAQARAP